MKESPDGLKVYSGQALKVGIGNATSVISNYDRTQNVPSSEKGHSKKKYRDEFTIKSMKRKSVISYLLTS